MYTPIFILFVAARAFAYPDSIFAERSIPTSGGWSLQSTTAVSGLVSCGGNAYCPSSHHCISASQSVAAVCCPTPADCTGAVEGSASPSCADPTWGLFKNEQGNGFCCAAGEVGVIDKATSVGAGACTAKPGSKDKTAQEVTPATGSATSGTGKDHASHTKSGQKSTSTMAAPGGPEESNDGSIAKGAATRLGFLLGALCMVMALL